MSRLSIEGSMMSIHERCVAIAASRGITRDCTPFLLILQGMTLQLQGMTLPSLLTLQGRSLTCVTIAASSVCEWPA